MLRRLSLLTAAFAVALIGIACSTFSDDPGTTPDAGPTTDGESDGRGGEDGGVDGTSETDGPIETGRQTVGCSDGTREGYPETSSIAACDGIWLVPGLIATSDGTAPATCSRQAGNTGAKADGAGCSAGDLCSTGWHVCKDAIDVTASLPVGVAGPCGLSRDPMGQLFYATAQPSAGNAACIPAVVADAAATNDLFGCGDLLAEPAHDTCGPLNALLNTDHAIGGWVVSDPNHERSTVQHIEATGGVLCCAD